MIKKKNSPKFVSAIQHLKHFTQVKITNCKGRKAKLGGKRPHSEPPPRPHVKHQIIQRNKAQKKVEVTANYSTK